jgi:hypothetical protein
MFNAVQVFYWPIIILIWNLAPAWTPYALAVLFGSHFLPYSWLYRCRGYGLLTILSTVVPTIAVLVADGPIPATIPLIAATCYAIAVVVLALEVRGQDHGLPAVHVSAGDAVSST